MGEMALLHYLVLPVASLLHPVSSVNLFAQDSLGGPGRQPADGSLTGAGSSPGAATCVENRMQQFKDMPGTGARVGGRAAVLISCPEPLHAS